MNYLFHHIKHFLTATNQHGVHSPFVYNYLTQCLYAKPSYKGSKTANVLLKSIRYFSIENFIINSKYSQIENQIRNEFGLEASHKTPSDLIYLDGPDADVLSAHKNILHNDSMILINNIYGNNVATAVWETLTQNEMITVSIDLFYCGILFLRQEQAKEHFKIRI